MVSSIRCEATIGELDSTRSMLSALAAWPGMRPQRGVQLGQEHLVRAQQRLDAERGGDVRRRQQLAQVRDGHQQHAQHAVGAVDQRQALLFGQHHRLDAVLRRAARRRGGRPEPPIERAVRAGRLALAHQHQRAVRQRREVAGAAQRAEFADHRGDAGVEHVHHGLHDDGADAGAAGGQGLGAQEHQRRGPPRAPRPGPCRRRGCGSAISAAGCAVRRDVPVGQRAEAGGDAVGRDLASAPARQCGRGPWRLRPGLPG